MSRIHQGLCVAGAVVALACAGCSKTEKAASESNPPASGAAPAGAPAAEPAAQTAAPTETYPASRPVAPQRATYTIPAGTAVTVRTTSTISTKTAADGGSFQASLHQPLVVNGVVIAPRGADVSGRIVQSDQGGRVKGRARLVVNLASVEASDGQRLRLSTSAVAREARATKKKDALKIGIGAGIGAAIGALAGGGRGAAIGAGAGGGAGTGAMLLTKGDPAVLPAETVLTFRLKAPVSVTEAKPGSLGRK